MHLIVKGNGQEKHASSLLHWYCQAHMLRAQKSNLPFQVFLSVNSGALGLLCPDSVTTVPPGYFPSATVGKYFAVKADSSLTYSMGRVLCSRDGGQLATIKTPEEAISLSALLDGSKDCFVYRA